MSWDRYLFDTSLRLCSGGTPAVSQTEDRLSPLFRCLPKQINYSLYLKWFVSRGQNAFEGSDAVRPRDRCRALPVLAERLEPGRPQPARSLPERHTTARRHPRSGPPVRTVRSRIQANQELRDIDRQTAAHV